MGNKFTEIEVREIDQYGDAQDVNHFGTVEAANAFFETVRAQHAPWVAALVIEKCVNKVLKSRRSRQEYLDKDYTTLRVAGDRNALNAGGWLDDFTGKVEALDV